MTGDWLPHFVCPECTGTLAGPAGERFACCACGQSYARVDGVWRFLGAPRQLKLAPLLDQYRLVREREGRRSRSAEYYRMLPTVSRDDPHARDWTVRRETYAHLLRRVLASGHRSCAVLDLGAGSGWLSHRLATLGHRVVAVDAIEDDADGLGAVRHYGVPIVAVHADFDALPFAPAQFDVIVFNGSLHYAADSSATLEHAHRLLAPDGTLVVMDSPMFRADADGSAMVADVLRRFASEYGLRDAVRFGGGYLTFASLADAARRMRLQPEFVPSRGPIGWRVRRQLARLRLGRQPAAFGLWVAR